MSDYVAHRLSVVDWNGRPDFAVDAFSALFEASGGVPRRLNQLAGRVMLHAAMEGSELIDARAVEAVASDMRADMAAPTPEPTAEPTPEPSRAIPIRPGAPDADLIQRLAMLEKRVELQDAALRRVLTLLVDWIEGDVAPPMPGALHERAA